MSIAIIYFIPYEVYFDILSAFLYPIGYIFMTVNEFHHYPTTKPWFFHYLLHRQPQLAALLNFGKSHKSM